MYRSCCDCAAASRTGCPNGLAVATTQKTNTRTENKQNMDMKRRKTGRKERDTDRKELKRSVTVHPGRKVKWEKDEKTQRSRYLDVEMDIKR